MDTLNRSVSTKENESLINNLTESLRPRFFTGEFYLRRKLYHFSTVFQKIEAEGILANSLYESSITLILKPDKDITRREN